MITSPVAERGRKDTMEAKGLLPHSKAAFAAARETIGISQAMLATLLHINPKTVKSWESPEITAVPSARAWNLVTDLMDKISAFTDLALEEAECGPVKLFMVRAVRKDIHVQIVNARIRLAMEALILAGRELQIDYVPMPEDTESLGQDMTGFISRNDAPDAEGPRSRYCDSDGAWSESAGKLTPLACSTHL